MGEEENRIEIDNPVWNRVVLGSCTKIYDLTHADTDEHSVALPAGYPVNTRAIIIYPNRVVGTGLILTRPVSGIAIGWQIASATGGIWMRAADGLFYYSLSVANDDWDIYELGYITGAK